MKKLFNHLNAKCRPAFSAVLLTLMFHNGNAQTHFEWAKAVQGSFGWYNYFTDMGKVATDASGNTYITGVYTGTLDFDPCPAVFNLTSNGGADVFVVKYNTQGGFEWAVSLGGIGYETAQGLEVDPSGNVIIAGTFYDIGDYDPGPSVFTLTPETFGQGNTYSSFITKLDNNGNFIWAREFTGPNDCSLRALDVDASGNVYTTGNFFGTIDFDPLAGVSNLTSNNNVAIASMFISKLNSSGQFVWAKAYQSVPFGDYIFPNNIVADPNGNVYTTGTANGIIDYDPGVSNYNLNGGSSFIAKLDVSGNFGWAKVFSSTDGYSVAVDSNLNLIACGTFTGTVDFDDGPGTTNLVSLVSQSTYICKYAASGALLWAKTMVTTGSCMARDIITDSSDNIYFTGEYGGTMDADPNAGVTSVSSPTGSGYVAKWQGTGDLVWFDEFVKDPNPAYVLCVSIALDASDNVYSLSKVNIGGADFDPTSGVFRYSAPNNIGEVPVLVKIGQGACTPPAAPANTTPSGNLNLCLNSSTTLEVCGQATLSWYDAPTGGNYLGGGYTYTTPILNANATYYVQDSSCTQSLSRTAITVNVAACPTLWYQDLDGDGYGDNNVSLLSIPQPLGFVANNTDCVDTGPNAFFIHPNISEVPQNGVDDNCNGIVDEVFPCTVYSNSVCSNVSITHVDIGGMINDTGCDGYADYTTTHQLAAAAGDVITYSIGTTTSNQEVVGLYIDYNGDGDFQDANEIILDNGQIDGYTLTNIDNATFTIPVDVATGNYYMRVICDFVSFSPTDPCYTNFGEAEDYLLSVVGLPAQYCTPTFVSSCTTNWIDGVALYTNTNVYMSNYSINTNNSGCGLNGYSDFTALDTLYASPGLVVSGYISGYTSSTPQRADIYIDYDNSSSFESGELVSTTYISAYSLGFANYITIPSNLALGDYRIRVIASSGTFASSPCDSDSGEAEDYILHIVPCVTSASAPVISTYYPTTICSGQSTNLEVQYAEFNGSNQWGVYTESCGGTPVLTYFGVNAAPYISPTTTTTFYIRAEGGCIATTECSSITITVTSPPTWYLDADIDGYYTGTPIAFCTSPGAGYTTTVIAGGDCNDNNFNIHPGVAEICNNLIDENCNGQVNEGCAAPPPANDSPLASVLVSYSSNMNYPNCYPLNGSCLNATDSPESAAFSGPDTWYRFVAQSTAATITLSSSSMDDAIALYSKSGSVYTLIDSENASSGNFDYERLNVTGLVPGTTYYLSVGAASGAVGASFTLCIQHLMPSGCASVQPVLGFPLCSNFKAIARGAVANGVTYNFTFTGVGGGASGTTTTTGANGLITLSNPSLALRYGGIYNVQIDVVYALLNSAGQSENITIAGSTSSANCTAVTISTQPLIEVKAAQRCNAVLVRNSYLIGAAVAGNDQICGAINFTYKFSQVVSCSDGTSVSVFPTEYTTAGGTPYLSLAVLSNLGNVGAWNVQIRPNFTYGPGVYGPVQRVSINNTSASFMLEDYSAQHDAQKSESDLLEPALYPNPNNGTMVNLNISNVKSDAVFVRILDALGQVVYANRFVVNGSLNTIVTFANALSSGLYTVEFTAGETIKTERMMVTK